MPHRKGYEGRNKWNRIPVRLCKKVVLIAAGTEASRNSPPRVRLPAFFVYRTLRPLNSRREAYVTALVPGEREVVVESFREHFRQQISLLQDIE